MKIHMLFAWHDEGDVQTYCRRCFPLVGDNIVDVPRSVTCKACLREYVATKFTRSDHRKALGQGWLLGETGIERDDDEGRFADDDVAAAYVIGRAEAGCSVARKALRYYGQVSLHGQERRR
jgi:hypothetical protein